MTVWNAFESHMSAVWRSAIMARLRGAFIALTGLAGFVALATYDPADPSLNSVGHDEVHNALGGFGGSPGEGTAVLGRPFLGLGSRPVVDGHVVAALLLQMSCHGIAHHAKPDECDRCHFLESFQSGDPASLAQSFNRLESAMQMNGDPPLDCVDHRVELLRRRVLPASKPWQ